jgi:Holliday junction resolvase-like predicted endonuclease
MSTFKYKGKTISIPNGYSQLDVLKSLRKGNNVYNTSFHSKEFNDIVSTHWPNRKLISKKAKGNVYIIEFNVELLIQNVVNNDFYFTIPQDILRDNRIKILIESSFCDLLPSLDTDQTNDKTYYNIIFNTINKYNLEKNRLCIVGLFENIKHINGIDYIPYNYFFYSTSPIDSEFISKKEQEIEQLTNRKFKITCLNRKPRWHRLQLFDYAFKNNLLENNHHTFAINYKQVKDFTNEEYGFYNILPYNTDLSEPVIYHEQFSQVSKKPLNQSYVEFITETRYEENGPVIHTEKTSCPIITLQPFVIVSNPGSLKVLKDKGYKTFDKWWSEEYDDIINNNERIKVICELYKEMSNWTHDDWKNIVYEMKSTLLHNANLYRKQYKQDVLLHDINNYIEKFNLDK